MATTYKSFLNNDVANTRTMLHEAIPITGTIVSGTYYIASTTTQTNIKRYSHGMFESVFDYPHLSSSANHIFDLSVGYSNASSLSSSNFTQNNKKINIYNQMAQVLAGHDATGSIRRFDQNGDFADGGTKHDEVFFINYSRLLVKDEIKKGSWTLAVATGGSVSNTISGAVQGGNVKTLGDYGAASSYKTNSPAGEYGIIYTSSATPRGDGTSGVGLIYYQAGVCVLTASIFKGTFGPDAPASSVNFGSVDECITGSLITSSCEGFRHRWVDNDFNNTTELNSTVYFCRANHNEYNYSSNPTYVSGSKIRVKNQTIDQPVSYITTVGLYSADNELLAVAKLSEPLKKSPDQELTIRVRLDY
tara:strand:+ start:5671 stop:6753 length:1083 start_codon:yes stop_codon:yes gene_type:complete